MKTRNIKIALLSFAVAMLVSVGVKAQSVVEVSYQTALPMGELSDLISNFSGRGMGIEYQYLVDDGFGIGLKFGWNTFTDVGPDNEIYMTERNGADVTLRGKKYDYVNVYPIMANVTYYIGTDDIDVRPLLSLGVGGMVINQRTDMGLFTSSEQNFHFGLSPKIGVDIPAGSVSIVPSITYNFAPPVKDTITYSYIGFNLGIKFM